MTDKDRYIVRSICQDFENQIGPPPADTVQMLLEYLAHRAALRAKYRVIETNFVNKTEEIERLVEQLA